jgi:hypothetical protein
MYCNDAKVFAVQEVSIGAQIVDRNAGQLLVSKALIQSPETFIVRLHRSWLKAIGPTREQEFLYPSTEFHSGPPFIDLGGL